MLFKTKNSLKLSVVVLGISSIITQIILLREFLTVFYGNELVLGIILANWMLLTGLGAYLGKFTVLIKNKTKSIISLLFLVAIFPIATVAMLSFLHNIIFPLGGMISLIEIIYTSFLFLMPFCVLSGFLFTLLCCVVSEEYKDNLISKIYFLEAVGCIIGGVIFNFILIYFMETFHILVIIMFLNLIAAFFLSLTIKEKYTRYTVVAISLLILINTIRFAFEYNPKKNLFQEQEIIYQKDNSYGNLVITKTGEQKNFFENGVLLFSTNNDADNEEAVHYAMVQHENPKNVLLISGGISGTTNEILKYNVTKIDYVEINPYLIDIGREYTTALDNDKVKVINKDAKLFVKETSELYDVVLINLPEPTTAQLNRFYTVEFFNQLKKKLNKKAVISTGLMSTMNYLSDEARQVNSILYCTLKEVFANVLIVPGNKNYFLASDKELSINISKMIEEKSIGNIYVNQYYINDTLLAQRSNYILNALDKNVMVNKDFKPVSYYQQILYFMSYFKFNYWIIAVILIGLLLFIVLRLNPINLGLFTAGFAASSIEFVLLISFQIIYGYVYYMTGIIITLFMAGLAIGAFVLSKKFSIKIDTYIKILFGLAVYSIAIPFIMIFLNNYNINSVVVHIIFFCITLDIAILTGMLFALASKLQTNQISSIAAKSYGSDLLGSAVGVLMVSAFLFPLLGIINVGIIIGALNILSGLIILLKRKKYLSLT